MVQHALDRGSGVVGVRRASRNSMRSPSASPSYRGQSTTARPSGKRWRGVTGVLTTLVSRSVHGYSAGTAQAVLDLAAPDARLVFSCGWHFSRDGRDVYSRRLKWKVALLGGFGKLVRAVDLDDQVDACRRVFASDTGESSCAAANSKAEARAFRRGAGMWATRSWRATSPGGWTSPCSRWPLWRHRRSSAAGHLRRSYTPLMPIGRLVPETCHKCRPRRSVLDPTYRPHDVDNLGCRQRLPA